MPSLSNKSEESSASAKRQKTEAALDSRPSAPSQPPNYGCKDYWEQRYAKQFRVLMGSKSSESEKKTDGNDDDDTTLPYHSWYFTYDELRPILLPILLGGREEARILIEQNNDSVECESEGDEEEDFDQKEGDKKEGDEKRDEHEEKGGKKSNTSTTTTRISSDNTPKGDEDKKGYAKDDDDENEEEEDIEIEEEGINDDDDDDVDVDHEEEEMVEREGLAERGPVAVLEIGCGDVPLGAALALELKELQDTTGASSNSIVTNITCTDYSQVVVDMMQRQYCGSRSPATPPLSAVVAAATAAEKEGATTVVAAAAAVPALDIGTVPLQFVVADARQLPYPDNSFAFVLEKGTLDAVLSDTDTGVADCVKIVTECARVASGCIVLISHLNAHTANGLSWLDEVVFAGLKQFPDIIWEIEVHGNSEIVRDDDDERAPAGTPGPAVYVIHKRAKPTGDSAEDKSTIPVNFFSY